MEKESRCVALAKMLITFMKIQCGKFIVGIVESSGPDDDK